MAKIKASKGIEKDVIKIKITVECKSKGMIFNAVISDLKDRYLIIDDGEHWFDYVCFNQCELVI